MKLSFTTRLPSEFGPGDWVAPGALLAAVRPARVQGGARAHGHPIVLRPVSTEDAVTADWAPGTQRRPRNHSEQTASQVPPVNRVALDVTFNTTMHD